MPPRHDLASDGGQGFAVGGNIEALEIAQALFDLGYLIARSHIPYLNGVVPLPDQRSFIAVAVAMEVEETVVVAGDKKREASDSPEEEEAPRKKEKKEKKKKKDKKKKKEKARSCCWALAGKRLIVNVVLLVLNGDSFY